MSGGSYNYIHEKIERFANELRCHTLARKAFKRLLVNVAHAAHEIEWVDSGDGAEDETAAIKGCFIHTHPEAVLTEAIIEGNRALLELRLALEAVRPNVDESNGAAP